MVKTLNNSSLNFKYSTLEKATECFAEANMLGQGGFGTVYKASLLIVTFKHAISLISSNTEISSSLPSSSVYVDAGSSVGRKRDSCEEAFLQ